MALVQQTSAKFNVMIRGNIQHYMEELHRCFVSRRRKHTFTDPMIEIEAMQSTIRHCEEALLQLSGVDKNFREAEAIGKAMKEVLSCLEDVLCSIMDGESEFFRMHKAGQFMYQSL